jgi:hypothetical protein
MAVFRVIGAVVLWSIVLFTVQALHAENVTAHRVRATIIRQESSLRTTVSNRDVYLVRITTQSGRTFDAVVVDSYPGYAEALPLSGSNSKGSFSMRLLRTRYCDRPDDQTGSNIPCFAVERNSVKTHAGTTDQWWR